MKKVFAKKYMVVFQREEHDEFVVYNTKKEWEEGHTHIHSYKQAMYLVDCIINNKIPKKVNKYFLVSLNLVIDISLSYWSLKITFESSLNPELSSIL